MGRQEDKEQRGAGGGQEPGSAAAEYQVHETGQPVGRARVSLREASLRILSELHRRKQE